MNDDAIKQAELVFGLVYPVGVDAAPVVALLKNCLTQFKYKSHEFRISKHLRSLELGLEFDDSSPVDLMNALMTAGNEARKKAESNDILAVSAINEIADTRPTNTETDEPEPTPKVAHTIRSFKRPEEVHLFRNVYRPGFFLIAIAADDDEQRDYLTGQKGLTDDEADAVMSRDREEHEIYGQRTRDTFYLADVFLELKHYKNQLQRFVDLVFGHPFITPTREEHAMFMAYASSARSAQLSRQVGAAVATINGEVVSVGFNEVPRSGGGSYWYGDANDHRDHKTKQDSNYENRLRIIDDILARLNGKLLTESRAREIVTLILQGPGGNPPTQEDVDAAMARIRDGLVTTDSARELVARSELSDITEYGRAVHAEMDAILTCARLGTAVRNKILFTTTFPCHNCTRHIIASGIRKLVYIEPYPKSKAKDLHSDAICFNVQEANKNRKLPFVPFVGIGPRRYLDLFSLQLSVGRKVERRTADHKPVTWSRRGTHYPRVPMLPYNYLEREAKTLDERKDDLRELLGEGNGENQTPEQNGVEPHTDGGAG